MKNIIEKLEDVIEDLKSIPPPDNTAHDLVVEYLKCLNSGDLLGVTQTAKKMTAYLQSK